MSPSHWNSSYRFSYVFDVIGSSNPGQLWNANVDYSTNGVVVQNFSLIKFFHNKYYGRKNIRETNTIKEKIV